VTPAGFAALIFAAWSQILLVVTLAQAPLAHGPRAYMPVTESDDVFDCIRMCGADAQADGQDDGAPVPHRPDHSGHDCVLCVVCVGHAWQAAVVPAPPILPERRFAAVVLRDAHRPRAPPVISVAAAQPRGPPALI
jgi:hypothetical protein